MKKLVKENLHRNKKFIFKKYIPTGKWRSFEPQNNYDIKLNGKVVGNISEIRTIGSIKSENEHKFEIGFMVNKKDPMEDGNPNCSWKWVRLKHKFESSEEAKKFISGNTITLLNKFDIRLDTE